MPPIASTSVIVPSRLNSTARESFSRDLYAVHSRVFDGVDADEFARYVVNSSARETSILLMKNADEVVVGYCALHIYEKELAGAPVSVFRAEAGMLRQYRGGSSTLRFAVARIVEHMLRHPRRPAYYLGCLVHPSSYTLLARYAAEIWPRAGAETPAELAAFIASLGDEFHLDRVDPEDPLVRHVGWRTRDSDAERAYWLGCQKPASRFFVQQNPGYVEGRGLLTLVPLRPDTVLPSLLRIARVRGERRLEGLRRRSPLRRPPRLAADVIVRALAAAPLFRALPEWDLDNLAALVQVVRVSPGEYLFQRDDPGDSMYLILEGAAYVVVEAGGEEMVLDELGPGEVFGEIALLTGARRSASIRAAGALVLLQINRAPFAKLLAARPDLRRALYLSYAQRIFRNYLPSLSPFAHVRADACHRWLAAADHHDLVPRVPVETARDSYVFVLQGPVEIQGDDEWLAVQGPALVHVGYHARLHTPTGAVVFELPPPPDEVCPINGAPPFFDRARA